MSVRRTMALWAGLAMVAWAPTAFARGTCASNSDCESGFVCEVVGSGDCPAIACAEGEECEQPKCDAIEEKACVPGPCDSNADCGENQVCYKQTLESCSGGTSSGCSRDGECSEPEPEPTECTTEEYTQCLPRWAAPCEAAADCGPGFTCEAVEQCACSGGGGASTDPACPEGEECLLPEPEPETECDCEPTGDNYCKLIETECSASSDCEGGLVCLDLGSDGGVSCAGTGSGGDSGGSDGEPEPGAAGAGGGEAARALPPECETEEPEPMMLCVPAEFELWGIRGSDLDVLAQGGAFNSAEDGSATGAPRGDDSAGGGGPKGESAADADGSDEAAEDDGCSVTSARGATSQGLWLLLAAALLARRRRNG